MAHLETTQSESVYESACVQGIGLCLFLFGSRDLNSP